MADAMKVVRRRGILMEEAVPAGEGAMAAVLGMEAAKIEEILSGISGATLPITTARVRLSSPDMRRQCRGFGKVKRSRRKAGTSAERKRPVPFPDDGSCVPGLTEALEGVGFMELRFRM